MIATRGSWLILPYFTSLSSESRLGGHLEMRMVCKFCIQLPVLVNSLTHGKTGWSVTSQTWAIELPKSQVWQIDAGFQRWKSETSDRWLTLSGTIYVRASVLQEIAEKKMFDAQESGVCRNIWIPEYEVGTPKRFRWWKTIVSWNISIESTQWLNSAAYLEARFCLAIQH